MNEPPRQALAATSLFGLSLGDAFGETFFGKEAEILHRIRTKQVLPGLWEFTDDTVMGIAVFNQLAEHREIRQDDLAQAFASNYRLEPNRGYGGTAHSILRTIAEGGHWKAASESVFDGMGSMGNGAAMRAGPIGAYFSDDVEQTIEQARLSAEVTHANGEGIAGAIAVALAAHYAAAFRHDFSAADFFRFIAANLPDSDVRAKIGKAATVSAHADIRTATTILGNGTRLTAQDTVPFALWCAAHNHASYEDALWRAVSGLGDRDTICAIVGSIVILSAEADTIPETWIARAERIEDTVFMGSVGGRAGLPVHRAPATSLNGCTCSARDTATHARGTPISPPALKVRTIKQQRRPLHV